MDTRAFRLAWPQGTTVYELDLPELLALKQARMDTARVQPRCRRVTVGVDLRGDWTQALRAAGFQQTRPAVWVAEALLVYLDQRVVQWLLADLARLAALGSWLLVDVAGESLLQHPWMQDRLRSLADVGTPYRFGTDDPEGLLAGYGWQASVVQYGEDGANFGRWPYPVVPRDVPGYPRGYLVAARRQKSA